MKTIFRISGLILILTACVIEDEVQTLEGSWSCEETSEIYMQELKGTTVYPVYFAQDFEDDNIYYIDNFYQLGDGIEVKVKLSGFNLSLEKQTVDGIEFVGSGVVGPNFELVNLDYTADDGGDKIDHVKATYSR